VLVTKKTYKEGGRSNRAGQKKKQTKRRRKRKVRDSTLTESKTLQRNVSLLRTTLKKNAAKHNRLTAFWRPRRIHRDKQ